MSQDNNVILSKLQLHNFIYLYFREFRKFETFDFNQKDSLENLKYNIEMRLPYNLDTTNFKIISNIENIENTTSETVTLYVTFGMSAPRLNMEIKLGPRLQRQYSGGYSE